ncbi:MAG TPA: hypothetical protein DCR21_07995 [Succinivibrionaceae bacterium]|nr:hypothetical protein [Succinivibrio sp.]HAR80756.1 hypothetical protein [Succinivibrionaceae bacterium]
MRQNTSSPRASLPFQCFHTCTAPGTDHNIAVLFVRGTNHKRLKISLVTFPQHAVDRKEMSYNGTSFGIHRYSSPITVDNGANFQRYCFKIALLDAEQKIIDVVWYSSLGMSRERPLLQHCFAFELFNSHPQWAPDLICYEIFPDKFASSRGYFSIEGQNYSAEEPIKAKEFEYKDLDEVHCGGDLDGVADMLPYLRQLGCDGIYLTPIFKAPSVHKYDTEDYDMVDPHFGGNGALKRLRTLSLGYDVKILVHGTFNSTGDNHPWFDRQEKTGKGALHHRDSPYREYYTFTSDGEAFYSQNRPTLPKLDYESREVRHAISGGMNSAVKKWLRAPYGVDGWVIDSASQIGDGGVGRNNLKRLGSICEHARETQMECLLIGDFTSDARYALNAAGSVDGSINYTGFISPIRAFFGGVNLTGDPTPYTGEDLRRACEEYAVGVSQQVKICLVNQLDNPDLPRFYDIIGGDRNLYLAAIACLYTWRGIPCLYQGDEMGDAIEQYEIGPRSLIPFIALKNHHVSPASADIQSCLTELASMRRSNPALTQGSMVFITAGGAYFGFCRLYDSNFSIVLVNASRQQVKIDQESILFPLLAAIYMPDDCEDKDSSEDHEETLLIPLSGRNVRRTDHGEGLEGLYDMLSREKLYVRSYGATRTSPELESRIIKELVAGHHLTMPARSTVIINNKR